MTSTADLDAFYEIIMQLVDEAGNVSWIGEKLENINFINFMLFCSKPVDRCGLSRFVHAICPLLTETMYAQFVSESTKKNKKLINVKRTEQEEELQCTLENEEIRFEKLTLKYQNQRDTTHLKSWPNNSVG